MVKHLIQHVLVLKHVVVDVVGVRLEQRCEQVAPVPQQHRVQLSTAAFRGRTCQETEVDFKELVLIMHHCRIRLDGGGVERDFQGIIVIAFVFLGFFILFIDFAAYCSAIFVFIIIEV